MTRTIIMADDTEREFDKVDVCQDVVHCYKERDDPALIDKILIGKYRKVTTLPVRRIKEIE